MIICPQCKNKYDDHNNGCTVCGYTPAIVNGIRQWQDQEIAEHHYPEQGYETLARYEVEYFWFNARLQLIVNAINKYFPDCQKILDLGCGTGFMLDKLRKIYPDKKLYGSDIFMESLSFCRKRLPAEINLMKMDAYSMPFQEEFDLVLALDVLEHLSEDQKALNNIHAAVSMGGGIILTVPQHQFLYSKADADAGHVRRYAAKDLLSKVAAAGFTVVDTTSFISLLFPALCVSRIADKNKNNQKEEFKISKNLNAIFSGICNLEHKMINFGIKFPFGGSRLIVARKD